MAFVYEQNHQLEQRESHLGGDNILEGKLESWAKTHLTCAADGQHSMDEGHGAHHLVAGKDTVEYCQRSEAELEMNYWTRDIHQTSYLNCWDAHGALDIGH